MITKEKEAELLRLYHGEKWPIGTIAGQLGLHHTTVHISSARGGTPRRRAPSDRSSRSLPGTDAQ
ncbi:MULTISPECIES: hypothetical protein [Sorangium]|uniref:Transposase IS30-like HTH domain-containing protein n=1 Tax=Sorangium cellulosum TaxID=56 RepID=A0A4P2QFW7_SORCE|nr:MULTISPECIES: hypothetical protein [Sorangium]AUX28133.1 uncharacterized protein SOCE836_002010 [Sorangium cellulosum]WCQ87537.1 hypothetical protein NQZ70_00200 [Sorangium sp. Soce836]